MSKKIKYFCFANNNKKRYKQVRNKRIYYANTSKKKSEVATLISDKADFRAKNITKDLKRSFIMIKRLIHQEDRTNQNKDVLITKLQNI